MRDALFVHPLVHRLRVRAGAARERNMAATRETKVMRRAYDAATVNKSGAEAPREKRNRMDYACAGSRTTIGGVPWSGFAAPSVMSVATMSNFTMFTPV